MYRYTQDKPRDTDVSLPLKKFSLVKLFLAIIIACIIVASLGAYVVISPHVPESGIEVEITKGMSMRTIAKEAKTQKIVRSETLLFLVLSYAYDPTTMYAGVYSFTKSTNLFAVAKKLASKEFDTSLTRLTIPEGVTRKEIARIAEEVIPGFDTNRFLEQSKSLEGYLFPDTYYIASDFTPEQLVNLLSETFTKKLSAYTTDIETPSLTEYEVLILASIIEKEANDDASMKMVSGIFQNRLAIDMALQVDASVGYVLDMPLSNVLPSDLKLDTPYNTYMYTGLPPTPISNPGLKAIDAVLHPTPSSYLYYITGIDGKFYYAKTFEEHKRNISMYLR